MLTDGTNFGFGWMPEETNPTIGAVMLRRSWGTLFEFAYAAVGAYDEG
jgi:hypothetical protein